MFRPFYVDYLLVFAAVGATAIALGLLGVGATAFQTVLAVEVVLIALLGVVGVLNLEVGGTWGFWSTVLPDRTNATDEAGSESYDRVEDLPRAAATEYGLCSECGGRVPPERDHCPDCSVGGRWRK